MTLVAGKFKPVRPTYPLRALCNEEKRKYADRGYVKYEQYPLSAIDSINGVVGKYWTAAELKAAGVKR